MSEEYSSVNNWLSRLKPNTADVANSHFKGWMTWIRVNGGKFAKMTPDDLIEFQKQTDNGSKFEILDTIIQPYLKQSDVRLKTKKTRYSHIRSFFMHNRAELPRDSTLRLRSEREPVRGTLTVEEIKTAILACKPSYQAAFICMFQSAMDQEMFTYWNSNRWEQLKQELKKDPHVIKIDLPGRKLARNKRHYYTFIGRDAITTIKNWLQHRPESAEAIITDQYGKPLTKPGLRAYWTRTLRRLGIIPAARRGRESKTGKGLHEMRDVFRSQWSLSPADHKVGEYLMGHQIDPLEYDKSFRNTDFYMSEYLKALPKLQIMSSGEPFGRVEQSELVRLRQENKDLREELEANKDVSRELLRRIELVEKQHKEFVEQEIFKLRREIKSQSLQA